MDESRSPRYVSVDSLRAALVGRLLPLLTIFTWALGAVSVYRVGVFGFRPFLVAQAVILVATTALWLFRARLPVERKGLAIVAILALMFLTGLSTFGLQSAAFLLPPVIALLLAAMGYARLSLWSVVAAAAALAVAGRLFITGVLRPLVDPAVYVLSPAAWAMWIVAACGFAIVFSVPLRLIPEALRASEEKFAKIFHASPAPMSISRLRDGVYVDVNESFLESMEYRRDEIIGLSAISIGAWADPADRERATGVMQATGRLRNFEARHRTKTGKVGYSIASAEVVDLEGEPHILGVTLDITERKLAEEALRVSESRYRALVENTPDIIARFDAECRYLFVNGAIRAVSPIPPEEFPGKCLLDVGFTPAQAAERTEMVRRVFATGMPVESELTFVVGGRTQVYEWRAFPEFDDAGVVRSVLAINRNITVRKQAESDLTASMQQLHALARRMEIVREEERKAVSHEVHDELGQILTALRMDLMGLRDARSGGAVSFDEKVQSMLDLTGHAIESVQGIAARLRPGMLDYLGLLAAIEWQAEEFQKRSGVRVSLEIPREEPDLDDEVATALFRILQEALTNVARHAHASAVAVRLARTPGGITMTVGDDGAGIPPGKISDPASLGLMGMRERLHPFGGTCTIESPAEGGTRVTVRISLPAA